MGATGCTPGATEKGTGVCNNCPKGERERTRSCNDSCGWGTWGAWGPCSGGQNCTLNCCEGHICQSLQCN